MIQRHRSRPKPNLLALGPPKKDRPPLDPILSLQVAMDHHTGADTPIGAASSRSSIASVCFLPSSGSGSLQTGEAIEDEDDDSDSDDSSSSSDEEELQFQCHSLLQSEAQSASDPTRQARQAAAATSLLAGRFLASCHANGDCLLWDLNHQKVVQEHLVEPRGPGWMLRRLDDDNDDRFLYQTRDPRGTVSIHSWDSPNSTTSIASFATFSQTFCAATPCKHNSNLLALPSSNDSEATIRDLRMDPSSAPVAVFCGSGNKEGFNENDVGFAGRKHGMLTSLAFAESIADNPPSIQTSRPIVACGMESGCVFFHDLRMIGKQTPHSMKLSEDPVLALDMAPSHSSGKVSTPGVVAIAGMAGENQAQKELDVSEQGTVAILKATLPDGDGLRLRLRSRLSTCQPKGEGKPGVNLCRFQPGDGRLFAVGGWDQRVRIMDRSSNSQAPLRAVLRGHDASVNAMDWAPDSAETGLFATGAADGRIHVWRCFSK